MLVRLQSFLQRFPFSTLLPCGCALCGGRNRAVVCADCQRDYLPSTPKRCAQCALPLAESTPACGVCLQQPPAYDATIAVANYGAPIDQLVLGLKFGAQLGLAPWMAARLVDVLIHANSNQLSTQLQEQLPDLLCPVPLGERRLSERGYNQALEIARPLSHQLGVALEARLCIRQRETDAQALLPFDQRAKNMRQAFSLAPEAIGKIQGLHIGVVDDVMTTGRTLDEMARTLKHFGAARVTNFVFARTVRAVTTNT